MSRDGFDPMSHMFDKAFFLMTFRELNPQCSECHVLGQLTFSRYSFHNNLRVSYCEECPNYEKLNVSDYRLSPEAKVTVSAAPRERKSRSRKKQVGDS